MLARSARSVRLGRLPSVASLRLSLAPLVLGSGFACLGFAPPDRLAGVRPPLAVTLAPLVRFSVSLRKDKRYFREKRAFRGTHIFHENGIFGFCSASAPQKQDLQKSTLHNTQLWCIFYPSAFGYGKCPITCVMYKPLRLWLRGSTFLQKLRPPALWAFVLRLVAPTARLCRRATSAPTLRPTAFAGVRSPLSRLRPTAFAGVRPAAGSAAGRFTAPPPPPLAGSLCSALLRSAPWVVFCLRSAPTMLKKKIAKGFAFHNFFSNKTPLIQQFILILRCK